MTMLHSLDVQLVIAIETVGGIVQTIAHQQPLVLVAFNTTNALFHLHERSLLLRHIAVPQSCLRRAI